MNDLLQSISTNCMLWLSVGILIGCAMHWGDEDPKV